MDGLMRFPRAPVAGPRLGGSPPITSSSQTGYPWVDGDILYAADLNAAVSAAGVSVLEMGAVGDGITDDTAAIQAALNAYAGKTTVLIPDTGSPFIVAGLSLPSKTNLLLNGTLLMKQGTNIGGTGVVNIGTGITNVVIQGYGTIDGNDPTFNGNATSAGISTNQSSNIRITGITVQNSHFWNLNIVQSSRIRVHDVKMLNGGYANEFAENCDDCWITGCTIDGPATDFGFSFYGGVTNSGAIGNMVRNSGAGIYVYSDTGQPALSSNLIISDNIVYNNYAGIFVGTLATGNHSNIIIANNRCYGNNISGSILYGEIQVGNVTGVTITGNLVSSGIGGANACPRGIRVETASEVTVTGNTIYNVGNSTTAGTGLYFNAVTGLLATGNLIYDNRAPQYTTSAIGGTAGTGNTFIANLCSFPITITLNTDTVTANSVAAQWMVGTGTGTNGASIGINAAPQRNATVIYRSAGNTRWEAGIDAVAETGGNTGSDYAIYNFNDDGTFGLAFGINRATKGLTIVTPASFANDAAAATGGVPVGGIYRSGSALQVRVS